MRLLIKRISSNLSLNLTKNMNKYNLKALIFDLDGVIKRLRRAGADKTFDNFKEISNFY
jgi:hypothetical protein